MFQIYYRSFGFLILLITFLLTLGAIHHGIAQPFEVGFRSITFNDPDRNNRSIPCDVYYPAANSGNNVPLAEGVFPHIVFGHGFVMATSAYNIIASAFAEEGYIVLLPTTEGGIGVSHSAFARDLAFVADQVIQRGGEPGNFFYESISGKFAIGGHSMGGGCTYLSVQYLQNEPATLFTFAAAETSPSAISALASLSESNLLFAGEFDCVTPPADQQIPMYQAQTMSICKNYIEIAGGYHCQFNSNNFFCNLGENSCSPSGGINLQTQINITLGALLPWLRAWLREDCTSWDAFEQIRDAQVGFIAAYECALEDPDISGIVVNGNMPACPGETVVLTANAGEGAILWNTGSTATSISVTSPGLYFYQLSNGVCALESESVEVVYANNILPEVIFNGLPQVCEGGSLLLSADPASGTIVWSNGSVGPDLLIQNGGIYSFEVTIDGCTFQSDLLEIDQIADPMAFVLSPDGTTLCEGDFLTLTTSNIFQDVIWNTGDQGGALEVGIPGIYSYDFSTQGCLFSSTSLEVSQEAEGPFEVLFDQSLEICPGNSIVLSADVLQAGVVWSNGSNATSIEVSSAGQYSYQVFTSQCIYQSDTVLVQLAPEFMPKIIYEGFPVICSGDSISLSSDLSADQWLWNTGASTATILVKESGIYQYTATIGQCDYESEFLEIIVEDNPGLTVLYPNGLSICPGGDIRLFSSNIGGVVEWSNGITAHELVVGLPGLYYYQIGEGDCIFYSDTVEVTAVAAPDLTIVYEGDLTLCPGDFIQLVAGNGGMSASWNTGDMESSLTVDQEGAYYFFIDTFNCRVYSDTVHVFSQTDPDFSILYEGSAVFCEGENQVLIASNGDISPIWSNGSEGNIIAAFEGGVYFFNYEWNGCAFSSDTVFLQRVDMPDFMIDLEGLAEVCPGDTLRIIVSSDAESIWWSSNIDSGEEVAITQAGIYTFSLKSGDCLFEGDSIDVFFYEDWKAEGIFGEESVMSGGIYFYEVEVLSGFTDPSDDSNRSLDWVYTWTVDGAEIISAGNSPILTMGVPPNADSIIHISVRIDDDVCKDTLLARMVILDLSTALQEESFLEQLILRTGPDNWYLDIQGGSSDLDIYISDATGRILSRTKEVGQGNCRLPHHAYPSGMYFINVYQRGSLLKIFKAIKI